MFPEELMQIIVKYKSNNQTQIRNIYNNLCEIIASLKDIQNNMASDLYKISISDHATNSIELLNDINALKEQITYIKSFTSNQQSTKLKDKVSKEHLRETENDTMPIFSKRIILYLVSDDLCSFCNVKLIKHNIHYERIINNKIHKELIIGYRCPVCNRLFVVDYEIEDFNFEETNIICNKECYSKVQFNDAIVVSNISKCSKHNHKIEDVKCELPIINNNGEILYQTIPIIYCRTCKKYIMLKSVYDDLNGIPLCMIIDETYTNSLSENDFYYGEGSGSKLKQYGYNVNCNDNLTIEQRHTILKMLLLAKYITKGEIYSILDTNIKRGSNRNESKRDWSKAVEKWKSDKKYVENIDLNKEAKKVNIDKIILKYIVH